MRWILSKQSFGGLYFSRKRWRFCEVAGIIVFWPMEENSLPRDAYLRDNSGHLKTAAGERLIGLNSCHLCVWCFCLLKAGCYEPHVAPPNPLPPTLPPHPLYSSAKQLERLWLEGCSALHLQTIPLSPQFQPRNSFLSREEFRRLTLAARGWKKKKGFRFWSAASRSFRLIPPI